MPVQKEINQIMEIIIAEIKGLFKDKLKSVILYGSYANGGYDDESDIDVMALVDMSDAELKQYADIIVDFEVSLNLEYDVVLSIITKDCNEFERWRPVLPFYQNVIDKGVIISG